MVLEFSGASPIKIIINRFSLRLLKPILNCNSMLLINDAFLLIHVHDLGVVGDFSHVE